MMNVDDQYCLELLHRTIVQQDAHARKIIQQHFSELLHLWVRCHPKSEMASQLNSEEHCIAEALDRFWQITSHHQPETFDSLVLALHYLRISLNSTIMDTLRTYSRSQEILAVEIGDATEPLAEPDESQCTCWEIIEHALPNTRTGRLAYLLFHCGLKPKEIVSSYPQEFSDIQEIYHLWCGIAEQLSHVAILVHKSTQDDK